MASVFEPPTICRSCGGGLPPDAEFCPSCGRSIGAAEPPTQALPSFATTPPPPAAAAQPGLLAGPYGDRRRSAILVAGMALVVLLVGGRSLPWSPEATIPGR